MRKGDKILFYMEMSNEIDFRKTFKVGQYHYGRHRSMFGVWVCDYVSKSSASSSFIGDFRSREEARAYVWKMNGWGVPKAALAR